MTTNENETNATAAPEQPAGQPASLATQRPLRVGVVGAGPAGIYFSDILLRELAAKGEALGLGTQARIDIVEKLPVPYGLVRYGVAPDHPFVRMIVGALDKAASNPHMHLLTGVSVGEDVSVEQILQHEDVLVFATGATLDRELTIPGAQSLGVHGAADFVRWYNGFPAKQPTPDYQDPSTDWDLSAHDVAVIGGGNVALDVTRMLLRDPEALVSTDASEHVIDNFRASQLRRLHLLVRRGPAQAKFGVKELRELQKLANVRIVLDPADFELDEITTARAYQDRDKAQMLGELMHMRDVFVEATSAASAASDSVASAANAVDTSSASSAGASATSAPERELILHFFSNPEEVLNDNGTVTGLKIRRMKVDADGTAQPTEHTETLPVQAIYSAIGYRPTQVEGAPYDDEHFVITNAAGRVLSDEGTPVEREYVTGWAKRGPVGLIGSTKSDAKQTVAALLEDLSQREDKGRAAVSDELLSDYLVSQGLQPGNLDGWHAVEQAENAAGQSVGRSMQRIYDWQILSDLSHCEPLAADDADAADDSE